MYIRYQYVRNFVVGLGSLSVFSLCGWGMCGPSDKAEAPAKVTVSAPAAPSTSAGGESALSDATIIARADSAATPKGKIKDAFPGPVKVNIYEDTGDAVWDRIKIDRNRDETWDAQWTREGGAWTRDDGQRWSGAGWGDSAPAAPSPNAPPAVAEVTGTAPAAELAELVDLMLHQRATSDKIKDLKRGAGPKINVYDDDKNGTWDRAKVDHDRDEQWDESWTVKAGHVERKKEDSGAVYLFKDGAWLKK